MKKIFLIFTFIIFFSTQTVFAASNYGEVKDITKEKEKSKQRVTQQQLDMKLQHLKC